MSKMKNGLELSKQSWRALRANRQLLIFPLISMIGLIIITALFLIPQATLLGLTGATSGATSEYTWILFLVVLFVFYLVANFLVIFSNTALVGAVLKLINGEPATVGDGLRVAWSHLGKIFVYALISATIGVIARSITQSGRNSDNFIVAILAAVIGGLIQGAWNLMVFFALPVMIVENIPVTASLKRSLEIFRQTWGESFVGSTAIGGISCLIYLVILLVTGAMIAGGIALGNVPLLVVGGIFMIFGIVVVSLLNGAVNGIFQASLYNFASTGNAGPFIDTGLAREAFG
jgi:hypothetical protein